eukprot:gene6267-4516_t
MDRYYIVDTLNQTDYSGVYRATRKGDEETILAKKIRQWVLFADSKEMLSKLCSIKHPHIVDHIECFDEGGYTYVISEFVEGRDLREVIVSREGQRITERDALLCFCPIVKALETLHANGICHRRLVPENVFLTGRGVVKLGDIGLRKVAENRYERRRLNYGVNDYMAPELLDGAAGDSRSDIWSLGCLLYELLMLQHPFSSASHLELVQKIRKGLFPPVPETYSEDTRQLIINMLRVAPQERITASEIMALEFLQPLFEFIRLCPGLNLKFLYEHLMEGSK